jgi:SAM-dependent methyltransferase
MAIIANVDAAAAWDGDEGDDWSRDWQRYDRAVAAYQRELVERAQFGSTDVVLDVGCGNGETTRAAARAATRGTALGVDLSTRMLERARELAAAEGITNVRFERADAQVHDFDDESFDVVVSRFGAMFFADRAAAFANLARALRSNGRMVLAAWQDLDHNEWIQTVRTTLAAGRQLPSPPLGGPGPLGLADPDGVRAVLQGAGMVDIEIDAMEAPFWVGADPRDAFEYVKSIGLVRGLLQGVDDATRTQCLGELETAIAAHATADGVVFGSGVFFISARKP